jgi:hypothetical protein
VGFNYLQGQGFLSLLTVILYGCETWSLTLREEHRLRVLEKTVLRIFGPEREEVAGGIDCIMSFITCMFH